MIETNFIVLAPEIFVLSMTCFILIVDLFLREKRWLTYTLAQLTLIGAAAITLYLYTLPTTTAFNGMFVLDKVASIAKLFIYLTTFFAFLYARIYVSNRDMPQGEYYLLGLFSMLGMMVLSSSHHLLTIFLGIELLSLPLYAMVALWRSSNVGSEAAMKYFVMGALTSGMLLYGMSMIYGATQSLEITKIASVVAATPMQNNLMLVFGLVFLVAGIAFKLGAAPFHLWVPDVYQGAPTSVTLFISSAPKLAAFVMTIRLLAEALPGLSAQSHQLLMIVALISISLGNIVAIVQNNLKRMLAYSAIAHMGYMSLGLLVGTSQGYSAAFFYMIVYIIMAMGAFGILTALSKAGFEAEWFEDLRGLNERSPWYAFMLLLIMFSMAGVPPGVGFFAKLGVLQAIIDAHITWLAVYALLFAIIGAYYYLRVVKMMYFDKPVDTSPIITTRDMDVAVSLNGLFVLILGLFPSGLIHFCRLAF